MAKWVQFVWLLVVGSRYAHGQAAAGVGFAAVNYHVDEHWPLNKTTVITGQPFSVGVDQATGMVYVLQRGGNSPMLIFDPGSGKLTNQWTEVDPSPNKILDTPHGMRLHSVAGELQAVWITDVGNNTGHVLRRFSPDGGLQDIIGVPGRSGSTLHPYLELGNVAELAFAAHEPGTNGSLSPFTFYVADGDGGPNNRLLSMHAEGHSFTVNWASGTKGSGAGQLDIPHDLDVEPVTGRVIVADRANGRLQVFSGTDGAVMEHLQCDLPAEPYGVRVLPQSTAEDLVLAVSQLQAHTVSIVHMPWGKRARVRGEVEGSDSACRVTTVLSFNATASPHLLDVHHKTGYVFVADVTSARVYKLVPAIPLS